MSDDKPDWREDVKVIETRLAGCVGRAKLASGRDWKAVGKAVRGPDPSGVIIGGVELGVFQTTADADLAAASRQDVPDMAGALWAQALRLGAACTLATKNKTDDKGRLVISKAEYQAARNGISDIRGRLDGSQKGI